MEEEKIIEGIVGDFKPLNEKEQEIVLKGLTLTYVECLNNAEKTKRKDKKKLWLIQAETYLTFIRLLTESRALMSLGFNHRTILLKALEQLWQERYGKVEQA